MHRSARSLPVRGAFTLFAVVAVVALAFSPVVGRVAAAAPAVDISAAGLRPATLTVTPGTTVTWTNNDLDRHRVRSQSGPVEFDSGDLDPGQTFAFTFRALGTSQYRDDRNPSLARYFGTVTVSAQPTPAPTPAPSGPGGSPAPTPAPATAVRMAGRAFNPPALTIDLGQSVTWINDDGRDHTVSARDQGFDSGVLNPGRSFVHRFPAAGTFAYLCLIHPDMTGTIVVRPSAGSTPPPPPSPTPKPTPIPSPSPGNVAIVDFDFSPASITVRPGAVVTFVNRGAALHTVTARDGAFDSGLLASGTTYRRAFPTPGTYAFFCSIHPNMLGTVLVSTPGGGTPPPPAPTPRPTARPTAPPGAIAIADFAFRPSTITIGPGTTLTWVNTGVAPHTVTSRAGQFDSGIISPGGRFNHLFAQPGTYQYFCAIHPDMTATILVPSAGGSVPPPVAPPPQPPPAVAGDIRIADFSFTPSQLQVPVGTTVHWVNGGVAPHTVTARDGTFDSGFLSTGDAYARTFATPGTFAFFCTIHPSMTGTVTVTGSDGSPAPVAASPSPPPSPPSAVAGTTTVTLLDFRFDPPSVTVRAGDRVRFTNGGAALHTATQTGAWDTGFMQPGEAAEVLFATPGTFPYVCVIHPTMTGTVVVLPVSPGASPASAAAQPSSGPVASAAPTGGVPPTAAGGSSPVEGGSDRGPAGLLATIVLGLGAGLVFVRVIHGSLQGTAV